MCFICPYLFGIMLIGLNPLPRYANIPYLCEWVHHFSEAVQKS